MCDEAYIVWPKGKALTKMFLLLQQSFNKIIYRNNDKILYSFLSN